VVGSHGGDPALWSSQGESPLGAGDSDNTYHQPSSPSSGVVGKPTDTQCDQVFLCFLERIAIWEAVAVYIQNQLLLHKVGQHPDPYCLLGGVGSPLGSGPQNAVTLPPPQKAGKSPQNSPSGTSGPHMPGTTHGRWCRI